MEGLPGSVIRVFSPRRRLDDGTVLPTLEAQYRVKVIKAVLPPGPTKHGLREDELLQFWAEDRGEHAAGGLRTIRTKDIIGVR